MFAPSTNNNQMELPTIHLNGTSKDSLQRCYDAADDALYEFISAWESIEFNARDYYVNGPESWTDAVEERQEMNKKIRDIRQYLQDIREHLHA